MEDTTDSAWIRPLVLIGLAVLGAVLVLDGAVLSNIAPVSVVVAFLIGTGAEILCFRSDTDNRRNRVYETVVVAVIAVLLLVDIPVVTGQQFVAVAFLAGTAAGALVAALNRMTLTR